MVSYVESEWLAGKAELMDFCLAIKKESWDLKKKLNLKRYYILTYHCKNRRPITALNTVLERLAGSCFCRWHCLRESFLSHIAVLTVFRYFRGLHFELFSFLSAEQTESNRHRQIAAQIGEYCKMTTKELRHMLTSERTTIWKDAWIHFR